MLRRILLLALSALSLACWGGSPVAAQQTEPRIALVVGNAAYGPGALPTALNDAGLVAEALRSVGFEIVEGADLSQPDLVRTFRDFLAKVDASGPDTLAFVYFSGHALSFEGDNFLLGVDARLERESDIPIEAVRLSDLLRPLADSPARAKVVMIDAARPLPFRPQGRGLARGLEASEAPQGMLIAYSSAPGTVAPDRPGNYGAYATAIAEMLRAPGTDLEAAFTLIRSRTHLSTEGQQTPWHVSALGEPIELVPPEAATAGLPPPPLREVRPMRDIGPDEAYALAIEMDSLDSYVEFVEVYPQSPYSDRVWAMIRARREALAWMRANEINTPQAYWTYQRRYPGGMYAFDAERRLRRLRAPFAPTAGFAMLPFAGVPLALRGEPRDYREVHRVGPPPPRALFRGQRPAFLTSLPPPRRGAGPRRLPQMSAPIPVVPRLAPAPRRGPPGASVAPSRGPAGRTPGVAPTTVAPSAVAPSTVTPSPGVAPSTTRRVPPAGPPPSGTATRTPSTVAPSTVAPSTVAPSTVTPSPGVAPSTTRRVPPAGAPPSGTATRTPGTVTPSTVAPSTVTPSPGAAPSTIRRGPPAGPPPSGTAIRTPSTAPGSGPTSPRSGPPPRPPVTGKPPVPPPTASRTPAVTPATKPAPVVRPAPIIRPAPPPPPRVAAPPPPRPAAPPPRPAAAAPKPPACPAGKTFRDGACR